MQASVEQSGMRWVEDGKLKHKKYNQHTKQDLENFKVL